MKRRDVIKGSAILGMSLAYPLILNSRSGMYHGEGNRDVHRVISADRTLVGTLPIMRAFAGDHQDYVSPYVLFDEFGPVEVQAGDDPLRVDAHPHAGVIPTTYFLDGSGHHKDSLNYDFQVGKGEFMMFSSGRGAIHMEETGQKLYDAGGLYHGFQIWLNMPGKYKMIDPATYVHRENKMALVEGRGFKGKVVLGELFGAQSDIELLSPAFYYHLKLEEGCRLDIPTNSEHNAFVYVVDGKVEITGRRELKTNQIVLYKRGKSNINLYSDCGCDLLILGGQPLNEQVYAYGPFVMNTEAQIQECIRRYQTGKMGNPDLVNQ